MVVINALVYKSEEDKGYIAEGYEISQIGTGDTENKAKQDLLNALKHSNELARKERDINLLDPEHASERCKEGLQKIILIGNMLPEIEKIQNLEIHFYKEIK